MLRDYQNETISKLFSSIREGNKRVLVVLSCGAGKSTIFSKVCELAQNGGSWYTNSKKGFKTNLE